MLARKYEDSRWSKVGKMGTLKKTGLVAAVTALSYLVGCTFTSKRSLPPQQAKPNIVEEMKQSYYNRNKVREVSLETQDFILEHPSFGLEKKLYNTEPDGLKATMAKRSAPSFTR